MDDDEKGFWERLNDRKSTMAITLPFLPWLGGFMYTWNQAGNSFWDAFIWVYYVGRYIAMHFTAFN